VEFNIQTYLHDMRVEQQKEHSDTKAMISAAIQRFNEKSEELTEKVNQHETRVQILEGSRRTLVKGVWLIISGAVLSIFDLLAYHWPKR
jgi:hypothetical protein